MRLCWVGCLLGSALIVSGSGCAAVIATAVTAGAVAATTVTTAGKVTVATVKSSGKVVTSAVTSTGDVTALTIESAAKLSRAGMVVAVDGSSGAVTEMPWEQGMKLYAVMQSARLSNAADMAAVFRRGRRMEVNLRRLRAGVEDYALESGDVVEFRSR